MTTGPYLYDDTPEALHTGTPRRRRGLLTAIFLGAAILAILAAVLLPVLTGSAADKAKEVTGVFLKALAARDTETAYGLLCEREQERLTAAEVGHAYLGATPGTVGSAAETQRNGTPIETVDVRWADGSTSRYTLVNESGPHICGTHPLG
jgi:type II secretory pathway pseudopilin PulG